MAEIMCEQ